jgi:hypothetical protein
VTAGRAAVTVEGLLTATAGAAYPGARMIQAAAALSSVSMAAADKLKVMLQFFQRIGFIISQEGVIRQGADFLMKSDDEKYAFRFIGATGQILYGRFNMQEMDYIWTTL